MQTLFVKNAEKFMEEVVFEVVCSCNVDTLVIARNGVVQLPKKYAGRQLSQLAGEICGTCLSIDDGEVQYLIKFYTLKTPLEKIVEFFQLAKDYNKY